MFDVINNLPAWLTSLISVFVGSFISYKATKRHETMRLLTESYADVFSAYTAAIPSRFRDTLAVLALVAAAEKTKLLCSKESTKILNTLIDEALADCPSVKRIGTLLHLLRYSAKADVNGQRRFTLQNIHTKRK